MQKYILYSTVNQNYITQLGPTAQLGVWWGRSLKGLAHAKNIKKSVILFRVLNMTIWCKHVHRLELQIFIIFVLRIHHLG